MAQQGMNRFDAQGGPRGGSPNPGPDMAAGQRGGFGSVHSMSGFKRALMKTGRGGNRLKDQLPDKTNFSGKGFKKPNYFAQGGGRHGMHIGSGAPFTGPADGDAGANFGG